jgi:CubicO group peptidase (beta-lactamase class C family)
VSQSRFLGDFLVRYLPLLPVAGVVLAAAACRSAAPSAAVAPAASPAADDARLHGTASGRHLAALVEAINQHDSAALRRFAIAHYSERALAETGGMARLLERWLEVGSSVGPIEIDSVIATTETRTDAWARGTISKAWLSFRLFADTSEPRLVVRIGLGRGLRPEYADARNPVLAPAALAGHLERYLDRLAEADLFSGVVLVVRNGRPLIARTYGFADRERGRPMRLDTPFDIASTGKLFTAVAIGQLAERGALRLDDTLGQYVPGMPDAIGRRVTIRHLLEHSSGLGDLGPGLDSAMRRATGVDQMVTLLAADTTLAFPPGSDFRYSNRGYVLLGAVVERAGGRPYAEYVRREIFDRAGMTRTALLQASALPPDRAHRYTRYPTLRSPWTPGPRVEFDPGLDLTPGPHGGAYSAAQDLVRFAAALTGARLLREETLRRFTEPDRVTSRTLGFQVGGAAAGAHFGHGGGAPGMNSLLRVYPRLGHVVVVLSNFDSGANLAGGYISELLP